jgi:hypothetical protein
VTVGDYCKLIVACKVKGTVKDELKNKIEELRLGSSAYQSQEQIVSIELSKWGDRKDLDVIVVGQTKWGNGQEEFCQWLRPHVLQGSGEGEVYAMSFSEYSDEPQVWKLRESHEPS